MENSTHKKHFHCCCFQALKADANVAEGHAAQHDKEISCLYTGNHVGLLTGHCCSAGEMEEPGDAVAMKMQNRLYCLISSAKLYQPLLFVLGKCYIQNK